MQQVGRGDAPSETGREDMRKQRIVGISFEHAHMGDLLREAHEHPNAEIVGICDPDGARMADAIKTFAISPDRVFHDIERCVREAKPDLAILCPATARHADCVEAVAPLGVDILLEKPFAASLADADRILAAVGKAGVRLAVNWPLRWYAPHVTAKRMIDEGAIGDLIEVHFYDGNRGPLYHRADKVVVSEEEVRREKPTSWWYKRSAGGGSLLDYLGYGATLGTWFMKGEAPLEVTSVVDQPEGLEVDEHSITICRYRRGLSKLETRWGAFTDPWIARTTIIAMDSWVWIPFMVILLLAGLQALPLDVKEAAKVDGANAWQTFWEITFPLMLPVSLTAIILRTIFELKLADIVINVTAGGPGGATDTISSFVYREYRDRSNVGYATTVAEVYLIIIIIIFITLLLKVASRYMQKMT